MLSILLIRIVLMALALLFVVPILTGGNVAVRRGGIIGALMTLVMLALVNSAVWLVLGIMGGAVVNLLTLGLFGILVNGSVLWLTAWLLPDTFQVRSFGWAVLGGLVMTVLSFGIQLLVP